MLCDFSLDRANGQQRPTLGHDGREEGLAGGVEAEGAAQVGRPFADGADVGLGRDEEDDAVDDFAGVESGVHVARRGGQQAVVLPEPRETGDQKRQKALVKSRFRCHCQEKLTGK